MRLITIAALAALAVGSFAGTPINMQSTGTDKGLSGGFMIWGNNAPNYSYWAGQLKFNDGSSTFDTLCCSLYQEFGLNTAFGATTYGLSSGTTTSDIDLIGLPGVDTTTHTSANPETSATFLQAAELFGHSYKLASTNEDYAGLQIAIWDTLYGNIPTGSMTAADVSHTLDGVTDGTTLDMAIQGYLGQLGSLSAADLDGVTWIKYEGVGQGQSQFAYNSTNTAVPEPVSLGFGVIALAGMLRRRAKKA